MKLKFSIFMAIWAYHAEAEHTLPNTPQGGISASKVSLRSLSGGYFKFLISKHSPDFLFFVTGFQEQGTKRSSAVAAIALEHEAVEIGVTLWSNTFPCGGNILDKNI